MTVGYRGFYANVRTALPAKAAGQARVNGRPIQRQAIAGYLSAVCKRLECTKCSSLKCSCPCHPSGR